jgi:hypothetical protein
MKISNTFTDEDYNKVVDFINFISKRAIFSDKDAPWKTEDTITHFKLLAYMQNNILPKIKANTLEIGQVVTPPKAKSGESD